MFLQEIRHSCRWLTKSPGFSVIAVLSIALGIGVNSALFSFHDAILLRPLPVRDPGAILTIKTPSAEDPSFIGRMSYPNFRDLQEKSESFDGLIAAQFALFSFARSPEASREMQLGMLVSGNLFSTLGVAPALGRSFTPEETSVPDRDPVVVLGYDFWAHTLGGDESLISGGRLVINGIEFDVIGVAPESFTGLDQFVRPAFYVPLSMTPRLGALPSSALEGSGTNSLTDRQARAWEVKGRLKSGVTLHAAQAEVSAIWSGLQQEHPDANRNMNITVLTEMQQRLRANPANAVISVMMTTLAALVLVIACANVANLLLGRARSRTREIGIRLALGVSRLRLLRQLLIESALLALLGAVAGLGFAYGGIRLLESVAQSLVPTDFRVVIEPRLDGRAILFSLIAAVLSAIVVGLAPAWRSLKTDLVTSLKGGDPAGTGRQRTIGRNALVLAQLALSTVLLAAAGMLQAGLQNTLDADPGFQTDHLMMMSLDTGFARYSSGQTHEFYRNLVERVSALPGVESVALADAIPLDRGFGSRRIVVPEGYDFPPGQTNASIGAAIVDTGYFTTLQTQILRGRGFGSSDDERAPRVAIVNEALAAVYWPNQDAIGKRIRLEGDQDSWVEVIGVSETDKSSSILEPPTPFFYLPLAQHEKPQMTLLAATANSDPSALAAPFREVVRTLDVNLPVFNLRTFSSFYRQQATGPQRLVMRTAGTMGLLGLTLSLIGLYGLVSYSVARRTREIGIRMAIGAGKANVLRMILRQGMMLSIAGILIGGTASAALARLMTAALPGLAVPSVETYAGVPLLLIMLTLAASYIPARRAARLDPLRALRYE